MLIDADKYWLMLVDADWCWMMLIYNDCFGFTLVHADSCWTSTAVWPRNLGLGHLTGKTHLALFGAKRKIYHLFLDSPMTWGYVQGILVVLGGHQVCISGDDWWNSYFFWPFCWLTDTGWCKFKLIDVYRCWLMLTAADWCWLVLIDVCWCCLLLIDADWCWPILIDMEIDYNQFWLKLFDADIFWLMLIDND